MRARLPAKLGAAVCLLLCAWFLAPLGMGIVHIGMLWPSALLVLAAARLLRPDVFRRLLRKKWLRWTVRAALGLGLAAALGIFGWMVSAAASRAAPAESTVIVLGCQVRGTEPSLTLQRRVDAAADYLRAHPQARCVASGGQSDDEEISWRSASARHSSPPGSTLRALNRRISRPRRRRTCAFRQSGSARRG